MKSKVRQLVNAIGTVINETDMGSESFAYDGFGRLARYENDDTTAYYYYTADNLRIHKVVNGAKTTFLWDGDTMFMSITGNELNSVTKYPGFMRVGSSLAVNAAEDEYYTFNGHGDVNSIVDINDNVLKLYDYDAFGNERVDNGEDSNPYRYCGEYYDVETGNIYLRARYYDPSIGRFISEDTHWNPYNMIYGDKTFEEGEIRYPDITASLQAGNLYAYCIGNPIKYVDINGNVLIEASYIAYWAWAALNIVIDIAAGYTIIKLSDLSIQEQTKIKNSLSYNDTKSASSYINWDKNDNGKNHVINGSKGSRDNHLPMWEKLGYNPNDPNGYDKLLEIFKKVVESKIIIETDKHMEHGKAIGSYINYGLDYVNKGVRVIVRIYTDFKTGNVYFSDAWGEAIGK